MALSLTINETLKWLSSLPILMQESFWWLQCSDRYMISLFPHLHTVFTPLYQSLISLMVSVDVKHHVYLLRPLKTEETARQCQNSNVKDVGTPSVRSSLCTSIIDDLRKSRGLHSVSAYRHGLYIYRSRPAGVAQSRRAFVGVQRARGQDDEYP